VAEFHLFFFFFWKSITNIDSVHRVGVFAQITSTFNTASDKEGGEGALTAVLYPHRRIKITDLIPPRTDTSVHEIQEQAKADGVLPPTPPATPPPTESDEESKSVERAQPDEDAVAETTEPASKFRGSPFQTSFLQDYAVSLVNVENLTLTTSSPGETKKTGQPSQYVRAIASEIISVFKDIATLNPLFRDQIANFSMSQGSGNVFEQPEKLADFAAAVSSGEVGELQDVLETMVLEERMQKALVVLKKELMNAQLQSKISREVEGKIQKRQREYYLMEQLKGIKKELGLESDGKDKMVEKFMEKAKALNMPETVRKVFDEEISKLQHLEPAASEFNVSRNYLDWLTSIPWGRYSEENFDIGQAVKILDEDHYGLQDVKVCPVRVSVQPCYSLSDSLIVGSYSRVPCRWKAARHSRGKDPLLCGSAWCRKDFDRQVDRSCP
jgi:Lon-like ATP-dependent protease